MKRRQMLGLVGVGALLLAGDALGQERKPAAKKPTGPAEQPSPKRLAIVGATLHRTGAEPLADAVIVIENGRIVSIGTDRGAAANATTLDVRGKLVTGGLIDPLTRVGVTEVDLEAQGRDDAFTGERAIAAGFAVADGYDPVSPIVAITRREGLTSVGVIPVS